MKEGIQILHDSGFQFLSLHQDNIVGYNWNINKEYTCKKVKEKKFTANLGKNVINSWFLTSS